MILSNGAHLAEQERIADLARRGGGIWPRDKHMELGGIDPRKEAA